MKFFSAQRAGWIVLCAAGWLLLLAGCATAEPPGLPGEVVTVEGVVQSVDSSEMAVDGPGRIRLDSDAYGQVLVVVPACEGPCSLPAVEALWSMETGQRWRVTGEMREDGSISVHDDRVHRLRRIGVE